MAEPRVSVLIVAKNEAHNLADCLAAASWAFERIVVVDPVSRDATLEIARQNGRRRRGARLRRLRQPAEFRTGAGLRRLGSVDRRRRARDAGPGGRDPPRDRPIRRNPYHGFRIPIRSVILGRPFGFSGTQHDHPLRLFRRDSGRWTGLVHETVALDGPVGSLQNAIRASLAAQHAGFSAQARPLHDAGSPGAGGRRSAGSG